MWLRGNTQKKTYKIQNTAKIWNPEITRIYKRKPLASIPIGRPKNKWEDDVRKNLQTAKIKNWKKGVLNRDLWKKIVERIKTHIEL
jgi:hypothetical protein